MVSLRLVAASLVLVASPAMAGERWLKIMPDDPYSKEGVFHQFDVDSVFEDRKTGLIASRMIYVKPEEAASGPAKGWLVWAFDCKANTVYYVSSQADAGTTVTDGWREKPNALSEPVMGGVTNVFAKKVCALKGSWPMGDLP
jgi:hypothetical protein